MTTLYTGSTLAQLLAIGYSLLEVLIVLVPVLLSVAFMTIIERKVLAGMQRRIGPNVVGYYGTLQPFADALKLVVKEMIVPQHATRSLFFLAPVISLVFSLLGWAVIPFGSGLTITDFSLGILYTMAISSVSIYGVLFAGWSANSKYAFLGALRSTAQMISYELILSSAILIIILLTGTFNITTIIEDQQAVWFVIPLLPLAMIFFVSALAETNRTPFDLPEAESELVAGFFTEHSSIIFVFFFLAEYCSIVLMSTLTAILFFGGYLMPELVVNDTFINLQSIVLALKTCLFCFTFVWFRATLPRLRFDQLISFAWLGLLPISIAFIVLVMSLPVAFDISLSTSLAVSAVSVKSKTPVESYFAAVKEPDTGGKTNNVHIIAKRVLNSGVGPTLDNINTVLGPIGIEISSMEFNLFSELPSVGCLLTDTSSDQAKKFWSTIGPANAKEGSKKAGVYIFTHIQSNKQYVGGTINAGSRVRSYLKPSRGDTGQIRPALTKYGLSAFKVEFIMIPQSSLRLGLHTALEQYYIFKLNPQYNTVKVAGSGGLTILTPEQRLKQVQTLGRPVYLYDGSIEPPILLHAFWSLRQAEELLGINKSTIQSYTNNNTHLHWMFFSWDLIDGTPDGVMDIEGLVQHVKKILLSEPLLYNQRRAVLMTTQRTGETWWFPSQVSFLEFCTTCLGQGIDPDNLKAGLDSNSSFNTHGMIISLAPTLEQAQRQYSSLFVYPQDSFSESEWGQTFDRADLGIVGPALAGWNSGKSVYIVDITSRIATWYNSYSSAAKGIGGSGRCRMELGKICNTNQIYTLPGNSKVQVQVYSASLFSQYYTPNEGKYTFTDQDVLPLNLKDTSSEPAE